MTIATSLNWLRRRAVNTSRSFKEVFRADDTQLRRAAEHVLADLRDFCLAQKSSFDRDPLIMARRAGRQEVFLRITAYLNLDEAQVQQLTEIDDGN